MVAKSITVISMGCEILVRNPEMIADNAILTRFLFNHLVAMGSLVIRYLSHEATTIRNDDAVMARWDIMMVGYM